VSGEFSDWLERRGAFYWVEESSGDWALVIGRPQLNRRYEDKVEERVAGTPLDGVVQIRVVAHDRADLEKTEERIVAVIDEWCLPQATSFRIDYAANEMVVGFQSAAEFTEAAGAAGISLAVDGIAVEEHRVATAPGRQTEPCEAPLLTLAAARERWESHGLDRYSYRGTRSSAWGYVAEVETQVWDGEVTEVVSAEQQFGDPIDAPRFGVRNGTVERLFDIVESHPVQWMKVVYDPEFGFPSSIRFNVSNAFDEGWELRVEGFRVLEAEPIPPGGSSRTDEALAIENYFPWDIVVVDAVVGSAEGVSQRDWGWRHTLDVTSVVYATDGAHPLDVGPVEVVDRVGFAVPRALLHRDGDSARLMLTHGSDGWRVFAVVESTSRGLRLEGPPVRRGYGDELAYLCHYPRSDIPTVPAPQRDAEAEFDLLTQWLDERRRFDPESDPAAVSMDAMRRVCGEA